MNKAEFDQKLYAKGWRNAMRKFFGSGRRLGHKTRKMSRELTRSRPKAVITSKSKAGSVKFPVRGDSAISQ